MVKRGICEWGIERSRGDPETDAAYQVLPEGFHIVDLNPTGGKFYCPRNLTPSDYEKTVPGDGSQPKGCPLYDPQECSDAFFETLACPTRLKSAKGRIKEAFE